MSLEARVKILENKLDLSYNVSKINRRWLMAGVIVSVLSLFLKLAYAPKIETQEKVIIEYINKVIEEQK